MNFTNIPLEILQKIAKLLPPRFIVRFSHINAICRHVALSAHVWRSVSLDVCGDCQSDESYCNNLPHLFSKESSLIPSSLKASISQITHLESTCTPSGNRDYQIPINLFPNLSILNLSNTTATPSVFNHIFTNLPQSLKILNLSKTVLCDLNVIVLANTLGVCRKYKIREINFEKCFGLTGIGLDRIVKLLSQSLIKFNISYCCGITDESIILGIATEIGRSCRVLERWDINGLWYVDERLLLKITKALQKIENVRERGLIVGVKWCERLTKSVVIQSESIAKGKIEFDCNPMLQDDSLESLKNYLKCICNKR
ncbi:hypothetical protein HK098_002737 [Nowakowskiella sp. JEL0407]|nr:hypothetical protein HK098_002737 [Nowakowskiella sp. JEL0407]